jgi:hypothetical protein
MCPVNSHTVSYKTAQHTDILQQRTLNKTWIKQQNCTNTKQETKQNKTIFEEEKYQVLRQMF